MSYRGLHSVDRPDTKREAGSHRDRTEQTTVKRYQAQVEAPDTDDRHDARGDGLARKSQAHEHVAGGGDHLSDIEPSSDEDDYPRSSQPQASANGSMRMRDEPAEVPEQRVKDDDIVEVVENHPSDDEKRHPSRSRPARLKKGTTRMPKRLVSQTVVANMGYAFYEEDHFLVLETPLEKRDIDKIIEKSKPYLDTRNGRQSCRSKASNTQASLDLPDSRWKALSAHTSISADATTGKDADERRLLRMALSSRRWG